MKAVPGTSARIADVANRAGVSVATVSRVVNHNPIVSPETRERVLLAIRELNYRPSSVARNLSLRRTLMIGVVVPFFTSPSAVERLRGIVSGLEGSSFDLALFDVESADRQRRAFDLLGRGDRVDGLLVVSLIPPDEELARLYESQLPCVLIDAPNDVLPCVVIDDVAAGEAATQHLIELGHRRIAFVGDSPLDVFRSRSSRDRTKGYERALTRAHLELREEYVREGTQKRHVARSITSELLRLPEPPTAIFAASDAQALGVLEGARSQGLRVPEDLSVIGFDDIEVASYAGLTTVRQPLFESGHRGAALLLQQLAGEGLPVQSEILPVEIVLRSTTAPPREQ